MPKPVLTRVCVCVCDCLCVCVCVIVSVCVFARLWPSSATGVVEDHLHGVIFFLRQEPGPQDQEKV